MHIKKIKPMYTSIVTTADKFEKDYSDRGVIMISKGSYKPWQRVIAVGTTVRDIHVGDLVMVNFDNYVVRKYSADSIQNDLDNNKKLRYMFNFVNIDDAEGNPQECFLFNDRDVLYSFEGEETDDGKSGMKAVNLKTGIIGIK